MTDEQVYVTDVSIENGQLKVDYSDSTSKLLDFPVVSYAENEMVLTPLTEAPSPKEVIDLVNAIVAAKPLVEVTVV